MDACTVDISGAYAGACFAHGVYFGPARWARYAGRPRHRGRLHDSRWVFRIFRNIQRFFHGYTPTSLVRPRQGVIQRAVLPNIVSYCIAACLPVARIGRILHPIKHDGFSLREGIEIVCKRLYGDSCRQNRSSMSTCAASSLAHVTACTDWGNPCARTTSPARTSYSYSPLST